MKHYILLLSLMSSVFCFSQNTNCASIVRDSLGVIKSAKFVDDSVSISSADEFFSDYLNVTKYDSFKVKALRSFRPNTRNEYYEQYYKGVRVEGAGYTFHFADGNLVDAHGHYVRIGNLNTTPSLSVEEVISRIVQVEGLEHTDTSYFDVKLLITEKAASSSAPTLAYWVAPRIQYNYLCKAGYVNAHTGDIMLHKPILQNAVATGVFQTLYRDGLVHATTELRSNNKYTLWDNTRGNGIYVYDIGGQTSMSQSTLIEDDDNYWAITEHTLNAEYVAFDAYWGMQQVYDRLLNTHNINSIDDNGLALKTYINYPFSDNAAWDPDHNVILIANSFDSYKPMVSIDDIAHELGHGIANFNIGWDGNEIEQEALGEGYADIWCSIMDFRTGATGDMAWMNGEKVMKSSTKSCIRNFKNPLDADFVIEATYGTTNYNSQTDPHRRGGVFPRWFYLLVNGGESVNSAIFEPYSISPVGMDLAENLIVNATFSGRLRDKTTFPEVREAFVETAREMGDANLVTQVQNAWQAVGVGDRYMSISGPGKVCDEAVFTLDNCFQHFSTTITWSTSNNNLQIVSGQGTTSVTVEMQGEGECVLTATVTVYGLHTYSVSSSTIYVGTPELGDLQFNADDGGTGYWNGGSARNNIEITSPMTMYYNKYEYEIYRFDNNWNTSLYSHFFYYAPIFTVSLPIGWYLVRARGVNDCSASEWVEGEVEMMDNWPHGMIYDPSSETLTIGNSSQIPAKVSANVSLGNLSMPKYTIEVWRDQKIIHSCSTNQLPYSVSMAGQPSGVYVVRIIKDEKCYSRKFVKP